MFFTRGFVSLGVTLLTPPIKIVHCSFNGGGYKAELSPEVANTAGKNELKRGTFCLGNAPLGFYIEHGVI